MDLKSISLEAIRSRQVAILGYGNQGRAHALNLRDSGVNVVVGARPGKGFDAAARDGFIPLTFLEAVKSASVVMFLLPDQIIPQVYGETKTELKVGKTIGFAHGFCYHFGWIEPLAGCQYFLVGPKGAGAILRERFEKGSGLPGVYALAAECKELETLATSYAKAIGLGTHILVRTSFQEETECDLFGEQAVLCGGIMQLMEAAFHTLTRNGFSAEMAFFECCYEAKTILDLWIKFGPQTLSEKISPTAFFGGLTRGRRIITEESHKVLEEIFSEIRSGKFAGEWKKEVEAGYPTLTKERQRLAKAELLKVYTALQETIQ